MLAENASDVVFLAGPDRCVRWVSPSVTRSLGWTRKSWWARHRRPVAPEASPQPNGIALRSTQARTPRPLTDTCSSFGQRRHLPLGGRTSHPFVDDDGSPAGVVSGVKIVDELVEAQRDLEAQRANLQAVFDLELDARVRLDPVRDASGVIVDFTYGDANPAALQYLQRPVSDLIGARLLHLFPSRQRAGSSSGMWRLWSRGHR